MAPFSQAERINESSLLALQISGIANDAPGKQYWYNSIFSWTPIVPPNKVWLQFNDIPPATTPNNADVAVSSNPTILQKLKVRLTLEITSNNRAFLARQIFEDNTSDMYTNWIQPALIRDNGSPSNGYVIRFYNGDPDLGGTEITTGYLAGSNGEPSWSFNYSSGILLVSTDVSSNFRTLYDGDGLYIVGYRYIGNTAEDTESAGNVLVYKGTIEDSSDFPNSTDVNTGWLYEVLDNVIDNYVLGTGTNLEFFEGDNIYWNGTTWVNLGNTSNGANRIVTAEASIQNLDSSLYDGNSFAFVVIDNDGNVIIS